MPDTWEAAHGLRSDLASDALEDPDEDGASNRDEYRAGTDPRQASSVFRVEVIQDSTGTWTIRFQAQADRNYTVQGCDALGAPWSGFQDIPAGVPREVAVPLPVEAAQRFYRVIIP
jgi:hypothetical protein